MSAFDPLRTLAEGTKTSVMTLHPKRRAEDSFAIFLVWTLFVGVLVWAGTAYAGGFRQWFSNIGAVLIAMSPLLPLTYWLWERKRARRPRR